MRQAASRAPGKRAYVVHGRLERKDAGECRSWTFGGTYELSLQVMGTHLRAAVDGAVLFDVEDTDRPLTGGGVALICEEGRMSTDAVTVRPAAPAHTGEEALP